MALVVRPARSRAAHTDHAGLRDAGRHRAGDRRQSAPCEPGPRARRERFRVRAARTIPRGRWRGPRAPAVRSGGARATGRPNVHQARPYRRLHGPRRPYAAGGDPQVRLLTSVGWTPTDNPADPRAKAHRQITADVVAIPHPGVRAPCALCVNGALALSGSVTIDGANGDRACGEDLKYGAITRDETTVSGPVAISGGAGAGAQRRPAADFDAVTFSPAVLDALKTLARRNGSYFGPGFPTGGRDSDGRATWSGRLGFDASNPLPPTASCSWTRPTGATSIPTPPPFRLWPASGSAPAPSRRPRRPFGAGSSSMARSRSPRAWRCADWSTRSTA